MTPRWPEDGSPMNVLDEDFSAVRERVNNHQVTMSAHPLLQYRLVYLASPYSKYRHGIEAAFIDVCVIAGKMLREGIRVYSPIAHGHPISEHAGIDPLDHAIWMPFDEAMMNAADACVIADMFGWQDSFGVNMEIKHFKRARKPVYRQIGGDYRLL